MLRSRNTSSGSHYQPVETSEYEILEHEGLDADANEPPLSGSWRDPNSHISSPDLQHWSSSRRGSRPSAYDEDIVQTISRADSVTLSHPTPGSSSLNGSNLANIERLELSAQRLSLSEDIGEELRKLQDLQKQADSRKSSVRAARQFSTNSQQNSIVNVNSVARSGGFSPEAYVASPTGSIMSPYSLQSAKSQGSMPKSEDASRSLEPAKEGRPLDFPPSPDLKVLTVRNSTEQDSNRVREEEDSHLKEPPQNKDTDRPNSAASGDTFRRAHDAFADFDGVHIPSDTPEIEDENHGLLKREASLSPPPDEGYDDDSQVAYIPPDHEELVYYPAPVPMMLSLPAKLSKGPSAADIAKRRSAILRGAHEASQSDSNLGAFQEHEEDGMGGTSRKRASKVPSQLRASAYFDQGPLHHDLQIIGGSATQTLESILDHSTYAPVTAFTDHPMIGREGAEVYNSGKASNNQKSTFAKRGSTQPPKPKRRGNSFFAFGAKLRGISKPAEEEEPMEADEGQDSHDQAAEEQEQEEDEDDEVPLERPATLLAELQIRKAQQKQRNRTAATAFPNGMHSTLLQLDAVAQVQKQARKQKQISLAWEATGDADEDPDEDVPLGVLFPGSKQQHEDDVARYPEDRPLGLLAQRNLEEQEPLSQRKSRLHGMQSSTRLTNQKHPSVLNLGSKGIADPPQLEDEEETLGQRRRRLRGDQAPGQPRPLSSDFASEVLSQFGVGKEQEKKNQMQSKTPDPEETLGQRKKRLQAEKARQATAQGGIQPAYGAAPAQQHRSMADLLQSNPVGPRQISHANIPGTSPSGLINVGQRPRHASTFQQPTMEYQPTPLVRSKTDQQPQSIQYPNPMAQYAQFYGNNVNAAGVGGQYYPVMPEQPPLHPQQRAMIDRWRQSVL
ncbi:hypothetical protein MMC10_005464 [Thelotrema lepadinum]|nr:hypothetical protein [Thelotrema lepadinum]